MVSSGILISGLLGISGGELTSSGSDKEFLLAEFSFIGRGGGGYVTIEKWSNYMSYIFKIIKQKFNRQLNK